MSVSRQLLAVPAMIVLSQPSLLPKPPSFLQHRMPLVLVKSAHPIPAKRLLPWFVPIVAVTNSRRVDPLKRNRANPSVATVPRPLLFFSLGAPNLRKRLPRLSAAEVVRHKR